MNKKQLIVVWITAVLISLASTDFYSPLDTIIPILCIGLSLILTFRVYPDLSIKKILKIIAGLIILPFLLFYSLIRALLIGIFGKSQEEDLWPEEFKKFKKSIFP